MEMPRSDPCLSHMADEEGNAALQGLRAQLPASAALIQILQARRRIFSSNRPDPVAARRNCNQPVAGLHRPQMRYDKHWPDLQFAQAERGLVVRTYKRQARLRDGFPPTACRSRSLPNPPLTALLR